MGTIVGHRGPCSHYPYRSWAGQYYLGLNLFYFCSNSLGFQPFTTYLYRGVKDMTGATITGTILGGVLGIIAWWLWYTDLDGSDLTRLIGLVILLGGFGGFIAYRLWQRFFY